MFTGTVIAARRDGEDLIYQILFSDNERKEMTAPELGQAMAMHDMYQKLQQSEKAPAKGKGKGKGKENNN